MIAGKVGLLRGCKLRYRYAGITSRGAASSSPLAPRPRSVLDWQMELSSASPSSQKLLGKLYQAIQSPFPPLRQNQVWIDAKDVETTLKLIISEKVVDSHQSERKDMMDIIMLCVQRCLKDAKRRVSVKIELDCERHEVSLSEEEIEAQVKVHPSVKEWEQLISSKWLGQYRLQNVITARRRPHLDDLQEAFSIVQQANSFGQTELNQLLNFVARFMPTPAEGEKKDRFLEMAIAPSDLRLQILDRSAVIKKTPPNLERLLDDYKEQTYLLPQDVVRVFETVWSRLCYLHQPDAVSYGTALLLESKLAPWRGLSLGSTDLFDPLRKVSIKLQKRKLLETSHVNQLMWATLRYDPIFQDSLDVTFDAQWPKIEDCMQLYQEMRGNAVQVEMEWERRQNGELKKLFGPNQWPNHVAPPNALLQREKGLPIDILPDQITYELLIRGLTWRGDLRRAASLFDEMTQSDVGTHQRLKKLKRDKIDSKEVEPPSQFYHGTFSTYDSFFRGFAKHSIPCNIVYFDPKEPNSTQFEAIQGEEEQNDWNMQSLMDLLDAYLRLDPKACREAMEGYRSKAPIRKRTWLFEDQIDKIDWFLDLDNSMMQLWDSIMSLENPEAHSQMETCPGPSPQQLFFLLTALRRASNDNARWVLFQWQRVVDKFGSIRQSEEAENQRTPNEEGWTGWKLNHRLVRVLDHLKSRM
jgi:hypothetical protein